MPTIGSFHRIYWRARANPVVAPGIPAGWMYPRVQAAVIVGSLFGALQGYYDRALAWWQVAKRLWEYDAAQLAAVSRVFAALEHPDWPKARVAVAACAHTKSFHEDSAWIEYSRLIKANKGQAQNTYRHIKAVDALRPFRDDAQATVSNPEAHLLVELAYQANSVLQGTRKPARIIAHPVLARREG